MTLGSLWRKELHGDSEKATKYREQVLNAVVGSRVRTQTFPKLQPLQHCVFSAYLGALIVAKKG